LGWKGEARRIGPGSWIGTWEVGDGDWVALAHTLREPLGVASPRTSGNGLYLGEVRMGRGSGLVVVEAWESNHEEYEDVLGRGGWEGEEG
jgi:hypothetical protein